MTFTAGNRSPLSVFLGGSLALVLTTLLGVIVGAGLNRIVPQRILHIVAAVAFMSIGLLLLFRTLRATS
jgi:putative Ca2+/H+ antiporter (TMEM165/GDT1 family)